MIDKYYIIPGGNITQGIPQGARSGRELTTEDARLLRVRYAQLKGRNLNAAAEWILEVMQALSITPPPRVGPPPRIKV